MANTVLKFECSNEELLAYFESVCKLVEKQEEFPVNLDDVWPLAYTEKGTAVRALKNGFIENVDYKTVDTITKREIGSTRTTDYFISVSCLEYLIARKHRDVFEVYRKVFHRTRELLSKPLTPAQMFMQQAQLYLEQEQRLLAVENRIALVENKVGNSDFVTVIGFANIHGIPIGNRVASAIGRKAAKYCRDRGIEIEYIHDARHGRVGSYPPEALIKPFRERYPRCQF